MGDDQNHLGFSPPSVPLSMQEKTKFHLVDPAVLSPGRRGTVLVSSDTSVRLSLGS